MECGTPLVRKGAGPKPTYCSGACRAKAGARRAKADGRDKKWASAAAERRKAERFAPTLDHVIPLAKGGLHEPGNLQLAHFICNSTKRDLVTANATA
ncbi:HNH endonuclease signature motif containing protein [Acrocarpospora sp. B8E8]|uniref:HNH endonuclease n=1 Tax=Acrocarpospora sp. B8E8 TaxID=3153572 RepID=UPI00325F5154